MIKIFWTKIFWTIFRKNFSKNFL